MFLTVFLALLSQVIVLYVIYMLLLLEVGIRLWCWSCYLYGFTDYAEKYQEMLDRQDYFHDVYGENGNEV